MLVEEECSQDELKKPSIILAEALLGLPHHHTTTSHHIRINIQLSRQIEKPAIIAAEAEELLSQLQDGWLLENKPGQKSGFIMTTNSLSLSSCF